MIAECPPFISIIFVLSDIFVIKMIDFYDNQWEVWLTVPLYWTLTHWGRDKMATILQTTFSKGVLWMEMLAFRLQFHESLFLVSK